MGHWARCDGRRTRRTLPSCYGKLLREQVTNAAVTSEIERLDKSDAPKSLEGAVVERNRSEGWGGIYRAHGKEEAMESCQMPLRGAPSRVNEAFGRPFASTNH